MKAQNNNNKQQTKNKKQQQQNSFALISQTIDIKPSINNAA
jgi:hypothetical protein